MHGQSSDYLAARIGNHVVEYYSYYKVNTEVFYESLETRPDEGTEAIVATLGRAGQSQKTMRLQKLQRMAPPNESLTKQWHNSA